jgi:hypothetical protein
MDDNSDEIDMAAVMGFSSFSDVPKPKKRKVEEGGSAANAIPLGQRVRATKPEQDEAQESNPTGLPILGQRDEPSSAHQRSENHNHQHQGGHGRGGRGGNRGGQHQRNIKDNRPYYPSEETDGAHPVLLKKLEELTKIDEFLLRGGVRDDHQRIVFFTKSMLEDPWEKLRKR